MKTSYLKIDSTLNMSDDIKTILKSSDVLEIQLLNTDVNVYHMINSLHDILGTLPSEITLHTPFGTHDIELMLLSNKDYMNTLIRQIECVIDAFSIHVNILMHTLVDSNNILKRLELPVRELLDTIPDGCTVLLENSIAIEYKGLWSGMILCEAIDSPKLRLCLDVTHYKTQAYMWQEEFSEYLEKYVMSVESARKYVKQIHFAARIHDGYSKSGTHAIVHRNYIDLIYDYFLLLSIGLADANYIIEVKEEEDYCNRPKMLEEYAMLNEILKIEENRPDKCWSMVYPK